MLLRLNRNTVNRYYRIFRRLVAEHQAREFNLLSGVVEVEESYFGPNRLKGHLGPRRKGRAASKRPVFGIYERAGRVYTEIDPDCRKKKLRQIFRSRVDPASILHTDQWIGYDGLVDVGYDKRVRIKKTAPLVKGKAHINGIPAFWSFTKRRLMKFNGVKAYFELHLKDCEWRYNKSFPQLRSELVSLCKEESPSLKPTEFRSVGRTGRTNFM